MLQLDWSYVLDQMQLANLYAWLDDIPFKREKRKLSRDFSDGGIHHQCDQRNLHVIVIVLFFFFFSLAFFFFFHPFQDLSSL